jgi:hypothetical protein
MDKFSEEVIERFWVQVDRSAGSEADWLWTGAVRPNGYGVFNLGVRQELAHRLALELSGVEIPPGFVVMQTCGNRLCCNPAHLRLGTRADQMQARSRLRRVPKPDEPKDPQGP